jgi:hypothetical protein
MDYKVLHDFEPKSKDEIDLKVGETVKVLLTNSEWWKGTVMREGVSVTGYFPGNHVSIGAPPLPPPRKMTEDQKEDPVDDLNRKVEYLPLPSSSGNIRNYDFSIFKIINLFSLFLS